MIGIEIWKFDTSCWKCDEEISVVYPYGLGGFGGGTWKPAGEKLAEKDYCNVQSTFSKTQGQQVYGNICPSCEAYQGNHFIHKAVFDTVAAYQSWDRAREDYNVIDVIDISYPCRDCGEELTSLKQEKLCERCEIQREAENLEGVSVKLEYCEVCEGILHPQHRAEHHTSYRPEKTMEVCDSCHAKIHHKPEFRDDLLPDMTRSEAEEQGFV